LLEGLLLEGPLLEDLLLDGLRTIFVLSYKRSGHVNENYGR